MLVALSVVPGPASLESLLGMQILRSLYRSTESETLGVGLAICQLTRRQEMPIHYNHCVCYKNNHLISDLFLTSSVRLAGPQVTFCFP